MKQKGNADLEGFEASWFVLKVWNHFKDNATPIGQQVLAWLVRYVLHFFQMHVTRWKIHHVKSTSCQTVYPMGKVLYLWIFCCLPRIAYGMVEHERRPTRLPNSTSSRTRTAFFPISWPFCKVFQRFLMVTPIILLFCTILLPAGNLI